MSTVLDHATEQLAMSRLDSERITDVDLMRGMLGVGRLTVTVESLAHGRHCTFRFRVPREQRVEGGRFLDVVDAGSEYGYSGVAHVQVDETGRIRRARVNRNTVATPVALKAARILVDLLNGEDVAGYRLHAKTSCCRCGRPLTTPESVEAGIGPECASKIDGPRTVHVRATA